MARPALSVDMRGCKYRGIVLNYLIFVSRAVSKVHSLDLVFYLILYWIRILIRFLLNNDQSIHTLTKLEKNYLFVNQFSPTLSLLWEANNLN